MGIRTKIFHWIFSLWGNAFVKDKVVSVLFRKLRCQNGFKLSCYKNEFHNSMRF
jgi:hypothetical protein